MIFYHNKLPLLHCILKSRQKKNTIARDYRNLQSFVSLLNKKTKNKRGRMTMINSL